MTRLIWERIKRNFHAAPLLWSAAFGLALLGQVLGFMIDFATWWSGFGASLIGGMAMAWVWLGILLKAQGLHPLPAALELKVRNLRRVATAVFWFGVIGFLAVPDPATMRANMAAGIQAATWVAILGSTFEVYRLEVSVTPRRYEDGER